MNRYIQGLGSIIRVPLDGFPPADPVLAFLKMVIHPQFHPSGLLTRQPISATSSAVCEKLPVFFLKKASSRPFASLPIRVISHV